MSRPEDGTQLQQQRQAQPEWNTADAQQEEARLLQQRVDALTQQSDLQSDLIVQTPEYVAQYEADLQNYEERTRGMSKQQAKLWKEQRELVIAAERARAVRRSAYEKKSDRWMPILLEKIEVRMPQGLDLAEYTRESVAIYTTLASEMAQQEQTAGSSLYRAKPQEPGAQAPVIVRLEQLSEELNRLTAETITKEQAQALYNKFLQTGETSMVPMEEFERCATLNVRGTFLLLRHEIDVAMMHRAMQEPSDRIDHRKFAQLQVLTTASGMLVSRMRMSDRYQDVIPAVAKQREEAEKKRQQEQAAQKQQGEQAAEARQKELARQERIDYNLSYLRTGKSVKGGLPQRWVVAPYAALIVERHQPQLEMESADFARLVDDYTRAIEQNSRACQAHLKGRGLAMLQQPEQLARFSERMAELLGEAMLSKEALPEETLQTAYERIFAGENALFDPQLVEDRLKLLCTDPALAAVADVMRATPELVQALGEGFTADTLQRFTRRILGNTTYLRTSLPYSEHVRGEMERKFIHQYGQTLVSGTPMAVRLAVKQFVANAPLHSHAVWEAENRLRTDREKAGIGSEWDRVVDRTLHSLSEAERQDPAQVEQILQALGERIRTNSAAGEALLTQKELTAAQWHAVRAAQLEWIDSEPDSFLAQMQLELEHYIIVQEGEVRISQDQYFALAPQTPELKKDTRQEESFVNKLCGEALCDWIGFGGQLKAVDTQVLETIFRLQASDEALAALLRERGVNAVTDLDVLDYNERDEVVQFLRDRILKNFNSWAKIEGVGAERLRVEMLPALLGGAADFDTQCAQKWEDIKKDLILEKDRFELLLEGKVRGKQKIFYRMQDQTLNTAFGAEKGSRPQRREARFSKVAQVRQALDVAGLTEQAKAIYRNAYGIGENGAPQKKSDRGETFHKGLTALVTDQIKQIRQQDKQPPQELEALQVFLTKTGREDFVSELWLSDYADLLFEEQDAYIAFTSKEQKEYRDAIDPYAWQVLHRERTLKELFDKLPPEIKNSVEQKERFARYTDALRPLIIGLKQLPADQRHTGKKDADVQAENESRFGVSDWEQVLAKLETYMLENQTPANAQEAERTGDIRARSAQYSARIERLARVSNGCLQLSLPLLEQRADVRRALYFMLDDEFEAMQEKLVAFFKQPIEELERSYGFFPGLDKQIFSVCGHLLLKDQTGEKFWETPKPFQDWSAALKKAYDNVAGFDNKKNKLTLKAIYEKLLQEDQAFARYFTYIFLEENLEAIFSEASRDQIYATYRARVRDNEQQIADRLLAEHAQAPLDENAQNALCMNVQMFAREEIVRLPQEVFAQALPAILERFRAQAAGMQASVEKAQDTMEQRRALARSIEQQKAQGRETFREDRQRMQEMTAAMSGGVSPMVYALRRLQNEHAGQAQTTPVPTQAVAVKQVQKQQKKIDNDKTHPFDEFTEHVLLEHRLVNPQTEPAFASALEALKNNIGSMKLGTRQITLVDTAAELFLQYVSVYGEPKTIEQSGETVTQYTQEQLDPLCDEFLERFAILQQFKSFQPSGTLAREHARIAELLSYGMLALDFAAFKQMATAQRDRLKGSAKLNAAASPFLTDLNAEERERVLVGLREYYATQMTIDFEPDVEELQRLLASPKEAQAGEQAVTRGIVLDLMIDFSRTMRGISYDDLTSGEHGSVMLGNRRAFEDLIVNSGSKTQLARFNQLTVEQRRVFALALTMPGLMEAEQPLQSMQFMRETSEQEAQKSKIELALRSFVFDAGAFVPDIDYDYAVALLRDQKNKLNGDRFDKAMELTLTCVRQQIAQRTDFDRLASGGEQVRYRGAPLAETVNDQKSFCAHLSKRAGEKDKSLRAQIERIQQMPEDEFARLVYCLQDRTVLDYTTRMGRGDQAKGDMILHVNEQKREEMIDAYVSDSVGAIAGGLTSELITNALRSLLSYQVRDDVDLTGRAVTKSDLKQDDHAVDQTLLKQALSLQTDMRQEEQRLKVLREWGKNTLDETNPQVQAMQQKLAAPNAQPDTMEKFRTFLSESVGESEEEIAESALLLTAIERLNERQQWLFVQALGNRSTVDITKKQIVANRFGLTDRDFADRAARDELLEQFLEEAPQLQAEDLKQAVQGVMSTQLDDSFDFSKVTDVNALLTHKTQLLGTARTTGVDWKLVRRALQFAGRAQDEREHTEQDKTLYRVLGDLSYGGAYQMDTTASRRNVHSAGNRLTHYAGRLVRSKVAEQIPGFLRGLLPAEYANKLNTWVPNEDEENPFSHPKLDHLGEIAESPVFAAFGGLIDQAAGRVIDRNVEGSYAQQPQKAMAKQVGEDVVKQVMEHATEKIVGVIDNALADQFSSLADMDSGVLDTGMNVVGDVVGVAQEAVAMFNMAKGAYQQKKAEEAAAVQRPQDQERRTREMARQQVDEETRKTVEAAARRNVAETSLAGTATKQRRADAAVKSVAVVLGKITKYVSDLPLDTLIEQAGEMINLLRSYQNDKKNVRKYFNRDEIINANRASYEAQLARHGKTAEPTEEMQEAQKDKFLCAMTGFQDMGEMASFVGLSMVQTLLFCASDYNPEIATRSLSLTVLTLLGCQEQIGKTDADSAQAVYKKIKGEYS